MDAVAAAACAGSGADALNIVNVMSSSARACVSANGSSTTMDYLLDRFIKLDERRRYITAISCANFVQSER